jgi:hypothetical protein
VGTALLLGTLPIAPKSFGGTVSLNSALLFWTARSVWNIRLRDVPILSRFTVDNGRIFLNSPFWGWFGRVRGTGFFRQIPTANLGPWLARTGGIHIGISLILMDLLDPVVGPIVYPYIDRIPGAGKLWPWVCGLLGDLDRALGQALGPGPAVFQPPPAMPLPPGVPMVKSVNVGINYKFGKGPRIQLRTVNWDNLVSYSYPDFQEKYPGLVADRDVVEARVLNWTDEKGVNHFADENKGLLAFINANGGTYSKK